MQNSKVNIRIKNILLKICSENEYVTIASIAKELNLSAKTVLREIPDVEEWLKVTGCSLDKKTGLGIRFKGSEEKRQEVIRFLKSTKTEDFYSPTERRTFIIFDLLQNDEPIKLYNFTKALKVTESTISSDLDKAEEWLHPYDLNLIRRPGYGIHISGTESNKRKAIVRIIHDHIDENLLLKLIRHSIDTHQELGDKSSDIEFLSKTRLLNLVDTLTINKLEKILKEYKFSDSAMVGMIVHLALVVKRATKGASIHVSEAMILEIKGSKAYKMAEELSKKIELEFDLMIPQDEVIYIAMHIKGAKVDQTSEEVGNKTFGNFELVRLAKEIIRIAEKEIGIILQQDDRLLAGLVNHLGPALNRIHMNMDIRNPLLDNIKTYYPELLKVSERCVRALEGSIGIKMPESEIAYIAMHLGAAVEKNNKVPEKVYRVAIACFTGIGTSNILATRIEKEYDNIQIVDMISALRIHDERLNEEAVDFIISTVKIDNLDFPVVTVNPLLFEEDKTKINKMIDSLKNKRNRDSQKKQKLKSFKEKLEILGHYSAAIIELLDNFFLIEDRSSRTVEQVIENMGEQLSIRNENHSKEQIIKSLLEREEKGSIVISGHHTVLIHCKTEGIDRLYFGGISVGLEGAKETIELGVVMLAPEGSNKYQIEVLSHVSKMLIERPEFLEALKSNDFDDAYIELNNILKAFYKSKVN